MKRTLILLLLVFTAITVWAQKGSKQGGSAGIGIMFSDDFNAAFNGEDANVVNIGFFVYGDFVYAEIICGMFFGQGNAAGTALNYLGAELGFYGKYPFTVTPKISLFPLLGFDFQAALYAKYDKAHFENRHIKWNQFWFKTGAGLDYKVNEKVRLRFEALYGIRPESGAENNLDDGTPLIINKSIGHSITLRIGVGL